MQQEYGFMFFKERCIACHGCDVACKSWRGVELGVSWRRVHDLWRGRYPEVRKLAVSVACMHCVDPECVAACPEGAIRKRSRDGIVIVDPEKCVGCGICQEACPFDVPQFGADGKMQKCDLCAGQVTYEICSPPCVETCPTQALVLQVLRPGEKREAEAGLLEAFQGCAEGDGRKRAGGRPVTAA